MFSWLRWWSRPRCPLGLSEKVWVERGLQQLLFRTGLDHHEPYPILIPSAAELPEVLAVQSVGLAPLVQRLCGQLRVNPDGLTVELSDDLPDDASGTYERARRLIRIRPSIVQEPAQLIKTLVHEFIHDRLLVDGVLTGEESDHEPLTDLAATIFGCGIAIANGTFKFESSTGALLHWWSVSKSGYLSALELGYAMAVLTWWRGDDQPPVWVDQLCLNARESYLSGLQYLVKTGDSYLPRLSANTIEQHTPQAFKGSKTMILGRLWDALDNELIVDPGILSEQLLDEVPAIRHAACRLLKETSDPRLRNGLYQLTVDEDLDVRCCAIHSFSSAFPADQAIPAVVIAGLSDRSDHVVRAAFDVIQRLNCWNNDIEERLLAVLKNSVRLLNEIEIEESLSILRLHVPRLEPLLRESFKEVSDPDELNCVLRVLRRMTLNSNRDAGK